jgi:hypothetical protein
MDRIRHSVDVLAGLGCSPTFPTPGSVVRRYAAFVRELQQAGAEIAVHSYNHIDLRGVPPLEACEQLERASKTFRQLGIEAYGFRCPYLSWSPQLLEVLPPKLFQYSSNQAIWLEAALPAMTDAHNAFVETINRFYRPVSAQVQVCVPYVRNGLIEIPVCVPDDIELHDGLGMEGDDLAAAWLRMLHDTYRRGESFTLHFHPELTDYCLGPLQTVLQAVRRLQPRVWVARLCEVAAWWQEKAGFGAELVAIPGGWRIAFACSDRATILARGLGSFGASQPWNASGYYRLPTHTLEFQIGAMPFLGLPADTPQRIVTFLQDQGYLLRLGEDGGRCAVTLDAPTLAALPTDAALIQHIEECAGPLVRFWRWPDGTQSAISVTGDLDALSLLDYARRLWGG